MNAQNVNRERLTIITSSEGGLNVGSQRTIASGPAVGDGDVGRTGLPGPANVLLGNSAVILENPNDVESQGISTEPWNLGKTFNHRSQGNRDNVNLQEW